MTLVVLDDVSLDRSFDLILNMETTSNIMILGIKEYRELCKISAGFFISGGILAIYNMDGDSALAFCNTLKRYKSSILLRSMHHSGYRVYDPESEVCAHTYASI